MDKITIPIILAVTVLAAGIFALMPVEQATAVHTTIQGTQMTQAILKSSAALAADDPFTCDSDADFIVFVSTGGTSADGKFVAVSDGAQTVTIFGDIFAAGQTGGPGFGGNAFSGAISADAAVTITITGDGTDDLILSLITTSGATADCDA